MGVFGGLFLTNKGRNLQVKAQTGIKLNFTRMAIGDGVLGSSSILELNRLRNERLSLPLTKLRVISGGQATLGAVLRNQEINAGFYFREIGIFATDPDAGEILYMYGNAGYLADYIPAGQEGSTDLLEKTIDVAVLVGNASNISATINQSLIYETPAEAQAKADTAKAEAIATADSNASSKAATAKSEAISAAAVDAASKVSTHNSATTGIHGATSAATANRLIIRDTAGRAKVAAPSADDDIAQLGTVKQLIANLVSGSPAALDTLDELARALGDDPNFATTITNLIGTKETPIGAQTKATTAKNEAINWAKSFGLGTNAVAFPGTDLNNHTVVNGFYNISSATNAPSSYAWHYVLQIRHSNNAGYVTQIAIPFDVPTIYMRVCHNGTWSAWQQIETTAGAQAKADGAKNAANTYTQQATGIALSVYRSGKDDNGVFTTFEVKNGSTLVKKSVLSIPDSNGNYTRQTIYYYASNGTTVDRTEVYTLAYDADGNVVSEVKQ
jgi:hypothetical protein